jgi:hypothetical protein
MKIADVDSPRESLKLKHLENIREEMLIQNYMRILKPFWRQEKAIRIL